MRSDNNTRHLHSLSEQLQLLSTLCSKHIEPIRLSPHDYLSRVSALIVKQFSTAAPHGLHNVNDSMYAPASVTIAICTGLIYTQQVESTYLEPLWRLFTEGGDTDSAGAMTGTGIESRHYIQKNLQNSDRCYCCLVSDT